MLYAGQCIQIHQTRLTDKVRRLLCTLSTYGIQPQRLRASELIRSHLEYRGVASLPCELGKYHLARVTYI